jgi:hypothetical protein
VVVVPYEAFNEGTNEEKDLETAAIRGFPDIAINPFPGRLLLASDYRPVLWRWLPGSHRGPERAVQKGRRPKSSTRERAEQRFTTRKTSAASAKRRQLLYQRLRQAY